MSVRQHADEFTALGDGQVADAPFAGGTHGSSPGASTSTEKGNGVM